MSHISASTVPLKSDVAAEDDVFRKITLRLIPFLFLCYLAAYLDRVNVGFAKLQMQKELAFSETVYGFGAGIFAVRGAEQHHPAQGPRPVVAGARHADMGCHLGRYGARQYADRILRHALLARCGRGWLHSRVLLYLTYWFPASRRDRITALFLTAIPMASILGGPISGWILSFASGAQGVERLAMAVFDRGGSLHRLWAILFYLDDNLKDDKWLDADEKQRVAMIMAGDKEEKEGLSEWRHAFVTGRCWARPISASRAASVS